MSGRRGRPYQYKYIANAELLRELMHEHHMGVADFARECSISTSKLYHLLNGDPSIRIVCKKICDVLGKDIYDIFDPVSVEE